MRSNRNPGACSVDGKRGNFVLEILRYRLPYVKELGVQVFLLLILLLEDGHIFIYCCEHLLVSDMDRISNPLRASALLPKRETSVQLRQRDMVQIALAFRLFQCQLQLLNLEVSLIELIFKLPSHLNLLLDTPPHIVNSLLTGLFTHSSLFFDQLLVRVGHFVCGRLQDRRFLKKQLSRILPLSCLGETGLLLTLSLLLLFFHVHFSLLDGSDMRQDLSLMSMRLRPTKDHEVQPHGMTLSLHVVAQPGFNDVKLVQHSLTCFKVILIHLSCLKENTSFMLQRQLKMIHNLLWNWPLRSHLQTFLHELQGCSGPGQGARQLKDAVAQETDQILCACDS
mmetsp:Transcript_16583/g.30035  ORF Transcript_16583/g.30035 Transcript_16583/m.30035 type:complete len:338 (-) Transcript_16583:545-1558(-)